MAGHPTRRAVLRAGTAIGACAGLGVLHPVMGQSIHTPEGALDRWYRGICGLCGMGDPLFLGVAGGALQTVKGDALSPVGYGRLCTRGMTFPGGLPADRRPRLPLVRRDPATKGSDGGLEPIPWDEALAFVSDRLRPLFRGDPGAVALLLDEGLPCESLYAWNRLHRAQLGSPTIETAARLGGWYGPDAALAATGLPGPTGTTEDLQRADLVLIVGADPAARQPTLMSRLVQCRRRGTTRFVVLDPRRTGTCGIADLHVRPRVPGTEGLILRAVTHALVQGGHLGDGSPLSTTPVSLAEASDRSGARLEDLESAVAAFADAGTVVSCYGPGLREPSALFDLHVAADRLRDGSTILPLTEGANGAGAALMGIHSPQRPLASWPAALRDGSLQALVTIGTNLLGRAPGSLAWREALTDRLLVAATPVQPTETTVWADLVLPMALPWVEERGCFVNLERRVQLSDPSGPPPDVPTSLSLALRLADVLIDEERERELWSRYEELGPELVWEDARGSTDGQPWNCSGMTYELLGSSGGLLWPFPEGTAPGDVHGPTSAHVDPPRPHLQADPPPPEASPDERFPLHLIAFDCAHHHGGREITGFVPELHYTAPRAWVELSGRDASRAKLSDGSMVAVESPNGVLVARLWITDRVPRGAVAIPTGFGSVSDLEGGTDGRAEPESLLGLLLSPGAESTRVAVREPTAAELSRRGLRRL